jgi:ribosomal protein S18 acetylase RimI-like enzyme
MQGLIVRAYQPGDEEAWVRCRALSFLGSAYFDDVRREKERYERPSIELVAEEDGGIVGLIDVECEQAPGTVCSDRPGLGGMIWHLAVHPDHQRRGIATALLREAERLAAERGLVRLEAWTRDDEHVQAWYESHGFARIDAYLHVYVELSEGLRDLFPISEGLRPVKLFAHYTGERRDEVKRRFARVHDCVLYEHRFEPQTAQGNDEFSAAAPST